MFLTSGNDYTGFYWKDSKNKNKNIFLDVDYNFKCVFLF